MRKILILTAVGLLAGCTKNTSPSVGFDDPTLVAGRDYIFSEESLEDTVTGKPRAFVILDKGNVFTKDDGRNMELCRVFESKLETVDQTRTLNPTATVVPTYWLVDAEGVANIEDMEKRCRWLVKNHDIEKANQLISVYNLPRSSTAYLVAIDGNNRAFWIDIDDGSAEQIEKVMRRWFEVASLHAGKPGYTVLDWTAAFDEICRNDLTTLLPQPFGSIGKVSLGVFFRDGNCAITIAEARGELDEITSDSPEDAA